VLSCNVIQWWCALVSGAAGEVEFHAKVTSSEITHLRAETEFWEGEASWNIFQQIFLGREAELASNPSRFVFF